MISVADRIEIETLLTNFAWAADRGDGDSLSGLFLPDAVLTVGGADIAGAQAIGDDCRRRFAGGPRKTRHMWSNLRIQRADAGEIETAAIQMTIEQNDPAKPTQLRINDLFDVFRKDSSGAWRFARRLIKRELGFEIK